MESSSLSITPLSISARAAFSYEWNKGIDRNYSCMDKLVSSVQTFFKTLFAGYTVCEYNVARSFLEEHSMHENSFFSKKYRELIKIKLSLKDPTNDSSKWSERVRGRVLTEEVEGLIKNGDFCGADKYLSEENIKLLNPKECRRLFKSTFTLNNDLILSQREIASKLLLTGHCDKLINIFGDREKNLLSFFVSHGIVSGLRYLLKHSAVDVNETDENGYTLLIHAVRGGWVECLRVLLDEGANPNICSKNSYVALHYAIAERHVECTKALLSVDSTLVDIEGKYNMSPLHFLAMWYDRSCAIELMKKSNFNVNVRNCDGQTALHLACSIDNVEYTDILLGSPNIMVNVQDEGGWTPLHMAAFKGYVDHVKSLLNMYYIGIDYTNGDGETAFDCATRENNEKCAKLLQEFEMRRNKE